MKFKPTILEPVVSSADFFPSKDPLFCEKKAIKKVQALTEAQRPFSNGILISLPAIYCDTKRTFLFCSALEVTIRHRFRILNGKDYKLICTKLLQLRLI